MRAVNLIPMESRRGSGGPGKSGGAVYGLIGLLGLLVVLAAAYAVSNKSIKDRQAELTAVQQEAVAAEARAGALAPYTQFATLRANRVQTVRSLVSSRFDWAHALREVSRTIPANAWLSTLNGSIAPGAGGAGGGGGGLRAALPVPAFEIVGCTTSHRSVSRMIARMRLIDGVQRVSLASTEKADTAGGGGGGASTVGGGGAGASTAGGGGDCRNGSDHFPKFELVVFFKPVAAPAVAGVPATPGAPAATSTSTTTSTTTATPAATPASTPGSPK